MSDDLLRALAVDDPRQRSQEGLDDCCFFCGEHREPKCAEKGCHAYVQLHEADCPWRAARIYLGLPWAECANGHTALQHGPPLPYKLREPDASDFMAHLGWEMEGRLVEQLSRPLFFNHLPAHDGTVVYKVDDPPDST